MASFTLLAVETAHIQSYLFNSNRLKENIGASYLVAQATGQWAYQCIVDLNIGHNLTQKAEQWVIDDSLDHINQNPALDVEVIYSGGGNFFALFRDKDQAKAFTRNLSKKVLKDAHGLSLTFVQDQFSWENDALSVKVSDLLRKLPEARSEQPLRRGVAGLGVTVMCNSSSLPATHINKDPDGNFRVYSTEVKAKQDAVMSTKVKQGANDYLRDLLALNDLRPNLTGVTMQDFALSTELDQLGRTKGQDSYMAVVHADGNGLGVLIQNLKTTYPTSADNPEYIKHMRDFSENIKKVNQQAQQAMFKQIIASLGMDDDGKSIVIYGRNADGQINKSQKIALHKEKKEKDLKPDELNRWVLPIRPLISGGDDVTFVCDGRIALDLAVTFLKEFEDATKDILQKQLEPLHLEKLTACAGVAIVKSHYPFARAYALADDLAGEAKQLVNRDAHIHNSGKIRYSAIDWHYTTGGIYDGLDEMREREYDVTESSALTLRPLFIKKEVHPFRNWDSVRDVTEEFQDKWSKNRSKAKALMTALRKGQVEVEVFGLRYLDNTLSLPDFANFKKNHGWQQDPPEQKDKPKEPQKTYCGYYDALELMDLYIPLAGEK